MTVYTKILTPPVVFNIYKIWGALMLFPVSGNKSTGKIMVRRHRMSRLAIFAIAFSMLLQACVYVPITKEVYDADCRVISKQMELQPVQIAAINHCRHNDCVAILAAATATAAASAVISGSIVVAGNVVYWFEKQGQCKEK